MSRHVLIVSPSFPPINAPDMQRVRMSLPHYREHGWEPVVLAVDASAHGGVREDPLLSTVPSDVQVYRCGAFSLRWTRLLGIGNLGLRSWCYLLLTGARILRREKIDLVFFSNTQFITFTLGRIWRWWFGVPYVIDLQDPWFTNHYQGERRKDRPGGWKYSIARFQARFLEGWCFRRASALISVSQRYIDDLRERHPWFASTPTETIGFGASETDLAAAKTLQKHPPGQNPRRLVYTGAVGSIMQPALNVLFDGVSAFLPRDKSPEASRLRIDFFGTSYAPTGQARPSVLPHAAAAGVADLVSEQPTRLGLLEALHLQLEADALLLLGSNDPAYSASKLYPYYLSGRPILAIVSRGSHLDQLLQQLSCAAIVAYDETGPTPQTREQIASFLSALSTGFSSANLPVRNDALFRREFLAPALTARQCALFDQAVAHEPR